MRKHWMVLLAILLCTALLGTAAVAEETHTYLAITSGYSPDERVPGTPEDITDTSRITQVTIVNAWMPMPMLLPEGSGTAEAYAHVGLRLTFDAPFEMGYDEEYDVQYLEMPLGDVVLEPTSIEVIGPLAYGIITELGEDYVVLDAYDEQYQLTGEETRYVLTPETQLVYYERPFEVGDGAQVIAGEDGVALAMVLANG